MRHPSLAAVALALVAATAQAQTASKADTERAIIANENAVNEAITKQDLAGFKKLVASDGWSVDPGGAMSVAEFEKSFGQVKVEPGWKISGSRFQWIGGDSVVHMYRWTGKGTFMGQPFGDTHSSTLWTKRGGSWVAVFHQETPVAPPAKK